MSLIAQGERRGEGDLPTSGVTSETYIVLLGLCGVEEVHDERVGAFGSTVREQTVAAYGDVFMLPLSAEHREAAGVKAGDQVQVLIALDQEPRMVDLPDDLAAALAEHPGARTAFDGLS